jgi:uncharacterized protein
VHKLAALLMLWAVFAVIFGSECAYAANVYNQKGEDTSASASCSKWLMRRMSCGRDADCIENAYERRIRQLKTY